MFILFVILQITSYLCSIKNKERLSTWTRKEAPLFSLTYCNNSVFVYYVPHTVRLFA
nr:MAG TPA: hypothetical protein [Caudoviricetes sp.]